MSKTLYVEDRGNGTFQARVTDGNGFDAQIGGASWDRHDQAYILRIDFVGAFGARREEWFSGDELDEVVEKGQMFVDTDINLWYE